LEERRAKERQYGKEHRERDWRNYQKLKYDVLSFYSGGDKPHCVLCKEERMDCLSIDHINNDGAVERRKVKKYNYGFYQYLKANAYPKGYQTLCMNCQFIKRAQMFREQRTLRKLQLILQKEGG